VNSRTSDKHIAAYICEDDESLDSFVGPSPGEVGQARISLTGGCAIGARPLIFISRPSRHGRKDVP